MNKTIGYFGVMIGTMMVLQWIFFLATGQVPEVQTAPYSIAFHLAAEFITAIALIVTGIAVLCRTKWGKIGLLSAVGSLIYSVIASPGYFAQSGQWEMVTMFMVILALSLVVAYFTGRDLVKSI